MIITLKYRLQPTPAQRTAMQGMLDAARWVYNKTLEVRRDAYKEQGETLSLFDTNKLLTQWRAKNEWLVTKGFSHTQQEAQMRVDLAFKAFFRRVKAGEKPGYPRFKGYQRYDSFTFKDKNTFRIEEGRLRIPKVGFVKIKLHRALFGTIRRLTVKRDTVGNWFAMFNVEIEPQPLTPAHQTVGVDLGLTKFAVLSNGEVIKRQRYAKQDEKDIARLQRRKERLPKGSSERRKANRALAHAYKRQTNRRNDFAHKAALELVRNYDVIAFEDLNIKEMQSNGHKVINRGIADVAWSRFVEFTTYKAEYAGRVVVKVDPKNTTQMCSGCGEIVRKGLQDRVHKCPHCGLVLDRDHNAAINILRRGLASLEHVS